MSHADSPVDLVVSGNTDPKGPCLGNGQTVLMRTPTQAEFVECWSEAIIRTGIPPVVVDNPRYIHEQNYSSDRQEAG